MRSDDMIYPNILIVGHAKHGKDTVAEMLAERGFMFASSSSVAADTIIMPAVEAAYRVEDSRPAAIVRRHMHAPFRYASAKDCFEDRQKWRAMWFDLIADYNRDDPARLGRQVFAVSDIYVGVRAARELHAIVNERLADIVIWVDACDRLHKEHSSSMQIEPWMADYVIDNNTDLAGLRLEVDRFVRHNLHSVAENHK